MEKKDLMIGDWLEFRTGYARVTGITDAGIHFVDRFGKGIASGADPIPLTAEILEKNGWKPISNTPYKLEYFWSTGAIEEYADIHIYVGKDHSNVWRWDFPILSITLYRGDMELTKFRYVHELQHAMRLCGIEKEIEL